MIELRGEWTGVAGIGEEELEKLRPKAELAVARSLTLFANELKKTLTGKRTGKTYKVSKRGKLHIASAPGEPPAVLYGNLRNSVGFSPPRWDGNTIEGEVGVGLGVKPGTGEATPTYARRLEYGGMDSRGVYLAPRPYIEPTAVRTETAIEKLLEEAGK